MAICPMNEHTLVYSLNSGWTPAGQLPPGPNTILTAWGWVERTFTPAGSAPAWYAGRASAAHPMQVRPKFKPFDPVNVRDRKLGCLHRLGKFSTRWDCWVLPTQDMVSIAIRLATDCGVVVYYRGRLGFEAEIRPRFKRPENTTYDFDVGANLLRFADRVECVPGPEAIRLVTEGPVLTQHRFLVEGR